MTNPDFELIEAARLKRDEQQRLHDAEVERVERHDRIAKIVNCHAWVEPKYKDWLTTVLLEVLP